MIKTKKYLISLGLSLLSGSVLAGSATASLQANATLNASCSIAASNVNFGTMTPARTGFANATGLITTTCSKDVPYTMTSSTGNSGDYANRTMAGADGTNMDKLVYNLYIRDANLVDRVWGDGNNGTVTVGLSGAGSSQTTVIYGFLARRQYIRPDNYSDNLTVTLAY